MTTDPSPFLTALRLSDSFLPVGDTRPPTVSSSTATRIGSRPATICGNCSRPTSVAWSVPAKLSRWPTLTPRAQNPISSGCWSSTSDSMRSPCPESSARVRPRRARSSPNCSGRTGGGLERGDRNGHGDRPGASSDATETATDGGDFAATVADAIDTGSTPGHYPVVFGVVTASRGLSRLEACLAHAYSFVSGLLGAAQRLGRFGHTEIQSVLEALVSRR